MKNNFLFLLLFLPLSVAAQRQIRTSRIEVTSALDAQGKSGTGNLAERILSPYKSGVDSVMKPVLGQSLVGMSAARPESPLSNWAADVLVWASDSLGRPGRADFGLVNIGGLRNSMPKGVVRRGDVLLISPFRNRVCAVLIKGTHVLALMRNIARVGGEGISKEVRLEITPQGDLLSATVGGRPIDANRDYVIATIDYLAEGNDGMTALADAEKVYPSRRLVSEAMMDYILAHKVIDARIEGRVTVVE
ncbi:MAG: 5'-nucleotidase C-terminal domain-containing protein [Bacteroidaceae bacterium]|nr:5'-nucleotidase C-terminal domain-containing protein [Prevotellaceae bacterium]MDY5631801.1 5'-nucleotidase C-terminal domain-containing protein [Bacteroidaceae bacterium]